MFCRFCGKAIQEDSEFCPYCGKMQGQTATPKTEFKISKLEKINIYTLDIVATIFFYVGIIGFLILYVKMAPGVGTSKFVSYIIGAAITIVAAVIVHKIRDKEFTHKRQLMALVFGLLLLIPALTLRIVYECKVDAAVVDIPETGTVYAQTKLGVDFYSYYYEGTVIEPYSYIALNGEEARGTTTLQIELNSTYSAEIGAGHLGRRGVASSAASGKIDRALLFSKDDLQNGYTLCEKVPIDGGYANVTIEFTRVCTFWEVIFYKSR